MSTLHDEITFSPGSIEFRDQVQKRLSALLKELAISRATDAGREHITIEDFKAVAPTAIGRIFRELGLQVPPDLTS